MMDINNLFEKLSYGELSNLSISDEGSGTIVAAKRPRIIHYANTALLRIFSRMLLKENSLLITQMENVTLYRLDKKHSVTNPVAGYYSYIQDTADNLFDNDVIRITSVYDQNGVELPINDLDDPLSVFIPQPDVLQLSHPVDGAPLGVSYQARHAPLNYNTPSQVIEIPEVLEEALTALISYFVFSHMNTQESAAKAMEHMTRYEAIVSEVIDRDLVIESVSTSSNRFARNGWV